MRAVVLAAGEGKRMRPLTANRPKVLLPVAGVPLLERLLDALGEAGVDDVTLVTHYKEEAVRSAFGSRVRYARQAAPRGTADAVAAAGPFPEDTLVVNGDCLFEPKTLAALAAGGPAVTAFRAAEPERYGVFSVKDGRATGVVEKSPKPPSNLANAGAYVVPAGFERDLAAVKPSPRGELELTDALNGAIARGVVFRLVEIAEWIEIGYPWDILSATERILARLKGRIEGTVEPGAVLKGEVYVGPGAVVKSGTYVEGPAWIGPDCVVGPNCYIRPNTALSRGAKVGNACEIKASVLMEGAHAAHLAYVGDSVIGARANLGAATVVANLRHDGRSVKVTTPEGERVDTRRRKMGVVLGDDVHTGINTSLNVGVILSAGSTTRPGEVVTASR
ncbi:MAG TPA: bifunctional sugar-1-phosphate nucleotidylyltransferase/acetyltransferase [Candidatus Thermoplasmatota archaeon]|nr:bifunctional sugar-1-phosphate nucleotidylyltransferase/acetyltransferase [Candidatus Thermoplasmatota archaeon]